MLPGSQARDPIRRARVHGHEAARIDPLALGPGWPPEIRNDAHVTRVVAGRHGILAQIHARLRFPHRQACLEVADVECGDAARLPLQPYPDDLSAAERPLSDI